MSDNAQKTPLGVSLNRFASGKAKDAIQNLGKSLPATVVSVKGSIVQVKFEIDTKTFTLPNVTIPLIGSEYVRPPIQPGCKGFVLAADAYLGGMSGIGGGVADLTPTANLTSLVFAPIGNSGWSTVDGNAVVIYGPNGVVLKSQDGATTLTLTPGGVVVTTGGDFKVNGISVIHHKHKDTQPGGGESGEPKPS
jgi:hypothetical protein